MGNLFAASYRFTLYTGIYTFSEDAHVVRRFVLRRQAFAPKLYSTIKAPM